MKRMQTFLTYALIIIGFYFFSNFLIDFGISSSYKDVEQDKIKMEQSNNGFEIEVDKANSNRRQAYFTGTVKNNSENPDEVKEEDFKYPGPKPMSKEQGIVMLADSTEAAVRSINEPTEEKIEKMVNNIIDDKLASGQLDNCDLTLRDISKIKKCFLKALNGIHHERIEYPDDNKKEKK